MLYIIFTHRSSTGSSFYQETNAWFLITIFIIIIFIGYYSILWLVGGGATLGRIATQFQKSSTEMDYRESFVFCVPMRPNVPVTVRYL